MSLHKAIATGKEHRREWRDSRAFDGSCRNHHGCPWCIGNRTAQQRRQADAARDEQALARAPEPSA